MKRIARVLLLSTVLMLAAVGCTKDKAPNVTPTPTPAVTSTPDLGDSVGDVARGVADGAGDLVRGVTEGVGDTVRGVGDAARDVGQGLQEATH